MNPAPTASVGAGTAAADPPNPNHPEPSLRTLPFSSIKIYKNGELVGTVRIFEIYLSQRILLVLLRDIPPKEAVPRNSSLLNLVLY